MHLLSEDIRRAPIFQLRPAADDNGFGVNFREKHNLSNHLEAPPAHLT
jgi:hypothetical protein